MYSQVSYKIGCQLPNMVMSLMCIV